MLNQRLQQKLLQKLSPQQILLMKLLHEAVGVPGLDHEGQVEVVGSLTDLEDPTLFEYFKRRAQPVEDGADAKPNQADGGTVRKNLNFAVFFKPSGQFPQGGLIGHVGAGIQRDGHIGFGG